MNTGAASSGLIKLFVPGAASASLAIAALPLLSCLIVVDQQYQARSAYHLLSSPGRKPAAGGCCLSVVWQPKASANDPAVWHVRSGGDSDCIRNRSRDQKIS
jgi:hypothetical protein